MGDQHEETADEDDTDEPLQDPMNNMDDREEVSNDKDGNELPEAMDASPLSDNENDQEGEEEEATEEPGTEASDKETEPEPVRYDCSLSATRVLYI